MSAETAVGTQRVAGESLPASTGQFDGALSLMATTEASPREKRVAWGVVVVSVVVFAALVPLARVKLIEVPGFIPGYVASLIVISAVTTVILLGQFVRVRTLPLLALAAAYFFDASILVPYILSFPGVFGEGTLIGDEQTTPWLYMFWHAGFPLFVIAYAFLRDTGGGRVIREPAAAAVAAAAFVIVLVVGVSVVASTATGILPPLLAGNTKTTGSFSILFVIWMFSTAALLTMWWRGIRSSLDVWICVVMVAWICDVGLSAVFNAGRYDVGYYFGRLYGLLALSFVLAVVLLETTGLHSRVVATATRLGGEVKEARERERQTAMQLIQAQKMEAIGALTGGIAHDFNNLLAIIIGNLDILVDRGKDDPDVKELGGEALDAALRGADLTQRLLAFARRQSLQPRQVDLNDLIGDITKLLSRTIGQNIEITLDLDPNLAPVVVDPVQLDAALTNLATNARDAMPNGGDLIIVTGNRRLDADYAAEHPEVSPGDYSMIEVSDTGTGIDPDVLHKIFEPFFTTKQPGRGTGLGLSMVYGFIKQSGGHINVYSERGIGTTFRLYLPRAEAEVGMLAEASTSAGTATGMGETVLTVEDNRSLRRVVVRQIKEMGYRVLEADNAAEAMNVLELERVDLLFGDVVMAGGMSGIDLARLALTRWPHLKVLLTSGFPETKLNGNGNGPIPGRLLNKPYRKEDLAAAIRYALSGS